MEIAEKLRLLRKRRSLTKKDLAQKAGISGYYATKLEEGTSKPSLEVVKKLADALGVGVEFFARSVLDDFDVINFGGVPLRMVSLEDISPAGTRNGSEWELKAPSLSCLKSNVLDDIVKAEGWGVNLTAESAVHLARIVSKLVAKNQVEAIVSLSPGATVVAGALSAVLYEKKKTQITSIVTPGRARGKQLFREGDFEPGQRVMLLEEVARRVDDLVHVADEVRGQGAKIVAGIAIIDLFKPEEREQIKHVLPDYKFVFSADDMASALEARRSER